MAVGGDGAQAVLVRMQIDAVEIIARLFGRDRHRDAFERLRQRLRVKHQFDGLAEVAEVGEILGRQGRQGEARAAADDAQAGLVVIDGETHVRVLVEMAHDVGERAEGRADAAGSRDFGRRARGRLRVEIGRRQRQRVVLRHQLDAAKDRDRRARADRARNGVERGRRVLDGESEAHQAIT